MSYFISKVYQSVKLLTALSGTTGAILAIVYGAAMSGGTIFIVGGSLCLGNSLFNLIEIGKVNFDIKKQLDELKNNLRLFSQENVILQGNVESLNIIRGQFVKQNEELQKTLDKSSEHVDQLEKIKTEYDEMNKKLGTQLKEQNAQIVEYTSENKSLKDNVDKILELHGKFSQENTNLKTMLSQASQQINEVVQIKQAYEDEIQKLNQNNAAMTSEIQQQNDIIIKSKQLIRSLAQFGDKYNEFAQTIDTDLIKMDKTNDSLENTSMVLKNLVEKLETQTFEEFDVNHDGVITREEFTEGLERL
jgi:chromosome segregation ATPase